MLVRNKELPKEWGAALTRIFGSTDWEEAFYQTKTEDTLPRREELKTFPSLGPSSGTLIKLIKDICGLYLFDRAKDKDLMTSPERVVNFAQMKLAGLPHEAFMMIFLNTQNEIIAHEILNEGTIDQVAVYPRRIIEKALAHHAAGLIIVHNHPSGHTNPSDEDKKLTRAVNDATRLIDVRLVDHLIVGGTGFFSFKENGDI